MNCRLCLNECADTISILNNYNWLELVYKYVQIKIEPEDVYSTNMCRNCAGILKDFHHFYQCVHKCQRTLQATQTMSINKQAVNIKKEFDQELPKNAENGDFFMIYEFDTAGMEQGERNQIMKQMSLNTSLHENILFPKEEESKSCDMPEENAAKEVDIEMTNDLTENLHGNSGQESSLSLLSTEMCTDSGTNNEVVSEARIPSETPAAVDPADIINENDIKLRTCCICNKICDKISYLDQHMRSLHKGVRPFSCKDCSKTFYTLDKLRRHFKIKEQMKKNFRLTDDLLEQTEVELRKCILCDEIFDQISQLDNHVLRKHKGMKPFSCRNCSRTFNTLDKMRHHFKSKENCANSKVEIILPDSFANEQKDAIKTFENEVNEKYFQTLEVQEEMRNCILCKRIFDKISQLDQHMRKHHQGVKQFSCKNCSKRFYTLDKMRRHCKIKVECADSKAVIILEDDCAEAEKNAIKSFQNTINEKYFKTRQYSRIYRRKQVAEEEELRRCILCKRVYSTIKNLTIHVVKIHNGVQPFSCQLCGLKFHTRCKLRQHFKVEAKCANSEEVIILPEKPVDQKVELESNFNIIETFDKNCQFQKKQSDCTAETQSSKGVEIKEETPLDIEELTDE